LKARFSNPALHTKILIVHPDFKFIDAVELMDDEKLNQRADCLRAIAAMRLIREEMLESADIHKSGRVEFIGYNMIPTWTGFFGRDRAFVSMYFSDPQRGPLNTLVLLKAGRDGSELPYFKKMREDAEAMHLSGSERQGFASLFEYDNTFWRRMRAALRRIGLRALIR
jgi:hypothetical protein